MTYEACIWCYIFSLSSESHCYKQWNKPNANAYAHLLVDNAIYIQIMLEKCKASTGCQTNDNFDLVPAFHKLNHKSHSRSHKLIRLSIKPTVTRSIINSWYFLWFAIYVWHTYRYCVCFKHLRFNSAPYAGVSCVSIHDTYL